MEEAEEGMEGQAKEWGVGAAKVAKESNGMVLGESSRKGLGIL